MKKSNSNKSLSLNKNTISNLTPLSMRSIRVGLNLSVDICQGDETFSVLLCLDSTTDGLPPTLDPCPTNVSTKLDGEFNL